MFTHLLSNWRLRFFGHAKFVFGECPQQIPLVAFYCNHIGWQALCQILENILYFYPTHIYPKYTKYISFLITWRKVSANRPHCEQRPFAFHFYFLLQLSCDDMHGKNDNGLMPLSVRHTGICYEGQHEKDKLGDRLSGWHTIDSFLLNYFQDT